MEEEEEGVEGFGLSKERQEEGKENDPRWKMITCHRVENGRYGDKSQCSFWQDHSGSVYSTARRMWRNGERYPRSTDKGQRQLV